MALKTKAKKLFGQNFLTDPTILETIILFSGIVKDDQVLEIGPGRGALTEHLLKAGARVHAIELDTDLIPVLASRFEGHKNFSLQSGDILQLPLREIYQEGEAYQVVANIPYYITAPIIKKLLTEEPSPQSITLLVQKEVAERLAGGAKNRSLLTVATQFYSKVILGPVIPKEYFDPIPRVDSQLVTLIPERKAAESDKQFFRVVRTGFSSRRKTLFNNLTAGRLVSKEEAEKVFHALGWPKERRAQELEIGEWLDICRVLNLRNPSEKQS